MRIVNLTEKHTDLTLTVFVQQMTWLREREEGGSLVGTSDKEEHAVKETPEEILRKIFG